MVKSNKKPNHLAELAKELKEQPAQQQPPPTSEPQQSSTSRGLFGLAQRLAGQPKTQPQASHPEPSQALSSAKTSKLFALDKQLHGKPNHHSVAFPPTVFYSNNVTASFEPFNTASLCNCLK
jgi:hypothetical protein